MLSTLLFDVGGVLIAPLDTAAVAANRERLAKQLGYPDATTMWLRFYTGTEWQAAKTGAMTEADMWHALLEPHGLTSAEIDTFFTQLFDGEGVLAEMHALVQQLHGRYRLAILSNASDILEDRLTHLGLASYFEPIVNSHRIGVAKPEVAAYEITLQQLGVPASEVFFIDDQARNTRVAERLGIASHVFTNMAALRADMAACDIDLTD